MTQPIANGLLAKACDIALRSGLTVHDLRSMITGQYLRAALIKAEGNKMRASRMMGVHRNTLDTMLQSNGLPRDSRWWRETALVENRKLEDEVHDHAKSHDANDVSPAAANGRS